jgi:hypothetical protein
MQEIGLFEIVGKSFFRELNHRNFQNAILNFLPKFLPNG